MRWKTGKQEIGELMEKGGNHVAFCSHCGRHLDTVFYIGELVQISLPGGRPHYGIIDRTENSQEGPVVILNIGANETESVHIDYVEKVSLNGN